MDKCRTGPFSHCLVLAEAAAISLLLSPLSSSFEVPGSTSGMASVASETDQAAQVAWPMLETDQAAQVAWPVLETDQAVQVAWSVLETDQAQEGGAYVGVIAVKATSMSLGTGNELEPKCHSMSLAVTVTSISLSLSIIMSLGTIAVRATNMSPIRSES